LTGLPEEEILAFVREGLVTPAKSSRREPMFDWEDLVLLRKAKELSEDLALAKVRRALRELVSVLPSDAKLETLRLSARAERLVVHEEDSAWVPGSGQLLFSVGPPFSPGGQPSDTRPPLELVPFPGQPTGEEPTPRSEATVARAITREGAGVAQDEEPLDEADAEAWFRMGCELEADDPAEAQVAYERALKLDVGLADAHINLGRLLHEGQRLREAERHYRFALAKRPNDVTASFNLAVLLEDLGRKQDALAAYISTLEIDPDFADAHYNLARLHERMGHRQHALRHYQIYRQLAGEPGNT